MTVEVRHLQRTEVGEAEEHFGEGNQGSSAMPHKRNPHQSERIAGLARLLRGYAQTGFENVPLWHERDISHSSAERVIFPDACIVLDFMLAETRDIVDCLVIHEERMLANLNSSGGLIYSQRVLLALVDAGMDRQEAYKVVQRHARAAWDGGERFRERLASDPIVSTLLTADHLTSCSIRGSNCSISMHCFRVSALTRARVSRPKLTSDQSAVTHVSLRHYPPHRSGKVRELFDLGDALLIVATDRLSAFDVILPTPIPGKGRILSAISDFWFDRTMDIIPNHRMDRSLDDLNLLGDERTLLEGRSSIVRKAARIDIECVVRGYLAGSGWKEYEASGTLAGIGLPLGLPTGAQLPSRPSPPAVKNDAGHDQNISRSVLADLVGRDVAQLLEARSLDLYERGSEIAARAGFTLADTKFELAGLMSN
jgi:phosphoribosylaminoimidazole-succinocarboxamide synthase